MKTLMKLIAYTLIFLIFAMIAFMYLGPLLGVDFTASQREISKVIELPLNT